MTTRPPLRVERVLHLLPDVDALVPLRSSLISASRRNEGLEAHLTVGKRVLHPHDFRTIVPSALRGVTQHLAALYATAVAAIEAEARGELAQCIEALLGAGDLERFVGRDGAARAWYQHALMIAEGERERWLEVEALQRLGALDGARGDAERGARALQRALVLAEAEGDAPRAARAALGLGELALERGNQRGAAAWLARGFEHAGPVPELRGRLALGMAAVQSAAGELAKAEASVRQASDAFAGLEEGRWREEVLLARARLAVRREQWIAALAHYHEALATAGGPTRDPRREVAVRLEVGALHLATGRLPDAEDEVRRAEEIAIAHALSRELIRVYLLLGEVRGREQDESGFVFFEKAIELSRAGDASPALEAAAYLAYGRFRQLLGDADEARSYFERAHEILDTIDDPPLRAAVEAELHRHARV